jgi:hypothetical protein
LLLQDFQYLPDRAFSAFVSVHGSSAAVCSKCPYINGSLQGEGVECCWKDNVNDYLLSVHDPESEQQRVSNLINKGIIQQIDGQSDE